MGESLNILVIDDDAGMRLLLTRVLTSEGHLVIAEESAEDGLAQLPFYLFDVAFVDYHLPGMDGMVLAEYLQRSNPSMWVMLITGDESRDLQREAAREGVEFLLKPIKLDQLLGFLDAYVQEQQKKEDERSQKEAPFFAPPIRQHYQEIADFFAMPHLPERLQNLLIQQLRTGLQTLSHKGRYSEEVRVAVFAGLLAARVFHVDLPRTKQGLSPYEEYDRMMSSYKKRREFTPEEE